jgi:hypothetical protein
MLRLASPPPSVWRGGVARAAGTHRRCWNLLRPSTDPLHQTNKTAESERLRKANGGGPWTDAMRAAFAEIKAGVTPVRPADKAGGARPAARGALMGGGGATQVDCHGRAGDVVFYHSRLGHHAGQNYSVNIRQAVLTRLSQTEESLPDHALLPSADIWSGWSERVRAAATTARL